MCSDFSCFTGIFERKVINEVVKWLITKKKSFPLFWKSLLKDLIPISSWKSLLFGDRNNLFGLKKMAEPARNALRVFSVSLGYDRFLIINFLKRKQILKFCYHQRQILNFVKLLSFFNILLERITQKLPFTRFSVCS